MATKSIAPNEFLSLIRRKFTNCADCGTPIKYVFVLGDKELCYPCHCQSLVTA